MTAIQAGILAADSLDRDAQLARLTAFDAELKAAAQQVKDAARYRWIRANSYIELTCSSPRIDGWDESSLDKLDAAVDAAIAKEQ
jgi:hypothetical protein